MAKVKLRKVKIQPDSWGKAPDPGAWATEYGWAVLRTEGRGREMFAEIVREGKRSYARRNAYAVVRDDDVRRSVRYYGSGTVIWAEVITVCEDAEIAGYADTLNGARAIIADLIADYDRDSDSISDSESDSHSESDSIVRRAWSAASSHLYGEVKQ